MSYFKRFTDFLGGFVAFAAIIHLIGEYMIFEAPELEGFKEKLKEFLDAKQVEDYRGYAIMAVLFVVSVIAGRIFEKMPYVSLAVSLLPLYQTVNLFSGEKLENFPSLYLIFALLHTSGAVIDALILDRQDGKRRGFVCAGVLGGMMLLGGVWLYRRASELMEYEDPFAVDGLGRIEIKIAQVAQDGFQRLVLNIAIMIAVSVFISLILRDVYFIDAILSAVPLAYAVDKVLIDGKITVLGELILILCTLYFVIRAALVAFEPMREEKAKE